MIPGGHKVYQSPTADIGIKSFYKVGTLGCNTPVAFTCLTGSAKMTTEGKQSGSSNITGVGTESDRFNYITCTAYRTAYNQRNIISDTFIAKSLVNRRKGKFNGNTYIIAYSCGSRTGTAAETVNGNNIGAASCNTAGNGSNIMNRRNLNNNRLFIFCCLFKGENKLS